jgi:predicted GIY-YIG superfamily endonuclease
MLPCFYVYLIQSESHPDRYYTGFTEDLTDRLQHHNAGAVPATKPFRPWKFKTYIAFADREQALAFERYLKSHSGRAFAKKRL